MADKEVKIRVCDECGEEVRYAKADCDKHRNKWGKVCRYAPKGDMLMLSVPRKGGRDFYDLCCFECLRSFAAKQAIRGL